MFLVVFEDYMVKKLTTVTEGDYRVCNDGYSDLIDITDPENPKIYSVPDSEWVSVEDGINE